MQLALAAQLKQATVILNPAQYTDIGAATGFGKFAVLSAEAELVPKRAAATIPRQHSVATTVLEKPHRRDSVIRTFVQLMETGGVLVPGVVAVLNVQEVGGFARASATALHVQALELRALEAQRNLETAIINLARYTDIGAATECGELAVLIAEAELVPKRDAATIPRLHSVATTVLERPHRHGSATRTSVQVRFS